MQTKVCTFVKIQLALVLIGCCTTCILGQITLKATLQEDTTTATSTAFENTHRCNDDSDCVGSGRCFMNNKTQNATLAGMCMCYRSCSGHVPSECQKRSDCGTGNFCDLDRQRCICESTNEESCSKRNLRVSKFTLSPNDPFVDESMELQCCINIDPKSAKLVFLHNTTVELKPSRVPPERGQCFALSFRAVQLRDSGLYTCQAHPTGLNSVLSNASRAVQVRAPVTLNLHVTTVNSTTVRANWSVNAVSHVGVSVKVETLDHRLAFKRGNLIDETSILIDQLKPASRYVVVVETIAFKDNRTASDRVHFMTSEDLPGVPQVIDPANRSSTSSSRCSVAWKAPKQTNGKLLFYEVEVKGHLRQLPIDGSVLSSPHIALSSTSNCADLRRVAVEYEWNVCEFDQLLPNRDYAAQVVAVNGAGGSEPAIVPLACRTDYAPPSDLAAPVAGPEWIGSEQEVQYGLQVRFQQRPDELNGPITCYYLAVVPHGSVTNPADWRPSDLIEIETHQTALETNLDSGSAVPPKYAYIAESYRILPETATVGDKVEPAQHDRCPVPLLSRYRAEDYPLRQESWYSGFLIARVDPDQRLSGSAQRRKRSQPNAPRYAYSGYFKSAYVGDPASVTQQHHSVSNATTAVEHEVAVAVAEDATLSLLVVLPLLCPTVVGALLFLFWRRLKHHPDRLFCLRRPLPPNTTESHHELFPIPRDFPSIAAEDVVLEYVRKHKNSDFLLTAEFEALPHYSYETTASDRPENATKNRYNDIKAFDSTRVILKSINNDPASDYINANYITAYKNTKSFIAAQGPLQETVGDFWRMIFEKDIGIVVMVTNLQERYRAMCVKYWPDQGAMNVGDLQVTIQSATTFADYVVRQFEVEKVHFHSSDLEGSEQRLLPTNDNGRKHSVTQYHYTSWNDYRAPDGTAGLLKFLGLLRKQEAYNSGGAPVLVHCSAGVGRTGTLIALDVLMDQRVAETRLDIFGAVSSMRKQRNFLVQSLEQYVFVYKALAELELFGETDVDSDRVDDHLRSLYSADERGQTNMAKEYAKLDCTLDDPRTCDIALGRNHQSKNRHVSQFLPFDRNRVILQPVLGEVDASYINASVLKGYFQPYIVTQDPMDQTVWDFWRMIIEQNATCIVALTPDLTTKYWPQDLGRNVAFGHNPPINVQFHAEFEHPSCHIRKLHLTSPKINGEIREIYQFIYNEFTTVSDSQNSALLQIPKTASFLDLIGKVLQRRNLATNPGPIVVHCNNGSTKSGLYVCVSLILERVRAEQKIDVFQTVKTLHAQRAGVLPDLEQYEFCYKAVVEYLQSFQL